MLGILLKMAEGCISLGGAEGFFLTSLPTLLAGGLVFLWMIFGNSSEQGQSGKC